MKKFLFISFGLLLALSVTAQTAKKDIIKKQLQVLLTTSPEAFPAFCQAHKGELATIEQAVKDIYNSPLVNDGSQCKGRCQLSYIACYKACAGDFICEAGCNLTYDLCVAHCDTSEKPTGEMSTASSGTSPATKHTQVTSFANAKQNAP